MMIDRIAALLDSLTLEDLDRVPPARQRKFAELCRHWQQVVERRLKPKPKSGVLADLSQGKRSESE
jgi:hypothetical protein